MLRVVLPIAEPMCLAVVANSQAVSASNYACTLGVLAGLVEWIMQLRVIPGNIDLVPSPAGHVPGFMLICYCESAAVIPLVRTETGLDLSGQTGTIRGSGSLATVHGVRFM